MQNRLRELRKKKKISQKQFAQSFNSFMKNYPKFAVVDRKHQIKQISYATVSRWELGTTSIPTEYLEALAKYFRVSIAYFLGERFNGFVDPLSQSLADTLTFLPPKVAEKAMDAAYSVIYSYEANQNETEHPIEGGKHDKCGLKNIRLLSTNDNDSKDKPKEKTK